MWEKISLFTRDCLLQVRLGTSPDSLESYFKGTTSTYNTSDMCGTPATNASNFIKVGTINDVRSYWPQEKMWTF